MPKAQTLCNTHVLSGYCNSYDLASKAKVSSAKSVGWRVLRDAYYLQSLQQIFLDEVAAYHDVHLWGCFFGCKPQYLCSMFGLEAWEIWKLSPCDLKSP